MEKGIQREIRKLEESVRTLDKLYESNQETILDGKYISDSDYDMMYLRLMELEKEHPELMSPDSPTQKMVDTVVDSLEKVRHSTPMLSLEKTVSLDGVWKFADKTESSIVAQEKLDGLTVVLTYDKGRLQQAVTRGDGAVGENVIHTLRTFKNVPKVIPFINKLEVRVEAILPFVEFEKANVSGEYSNPRNLASGTVRQLDSSIAQSRNLEGIAFELVYAEGENMTTITENLEFMKSQGFAVVNYQVFPNSDAGRKGLAEYLGNYETNVRKSLPHMIDGMVLKFNDISVQLALGATSKHPKWAIAYKFKSLEDSTTLLGITDQVGKSGQITPVAELETVNIDGVNISRATLHNYKNIETKDIQIGDKVVVARANDVIPQVIKSLKELRTGNEVRKVTPTTCPACGSATEFNGENLYCTGINCQPQMAGKLEHFVSRNAMNIDGLGERTIHQFFDLGLVRTIADIYRLHEREEEICNLDKFGKRKFDKMVAGIEDSKDRPLNQLLYGLSIRLVGQSATKDLAKEFKTMDNILASAKDVEGFREKLTSIPDFGNIMADSLIDFLSNPQNVAVIEELKALGLNMGTEEVPEAPAGAVSLDGKTFVVTGDVNHFQNRKELQAKIEELGGKVSGSVSKNTDYLINNDVTSTSSKNKKAQDLGVPIISEDDFLAMI